MPDKSQRQFKPQTILVLGADGPVGAEICRIGRSIGHEMVGFLRGGQPEAPEERWIEGVEWVDGAPDRPDTWRGRVTAADAAIWNWADTSALSTLEELFDDHGGRLVILKGHAPAAPSEVPTDGSTSENHGPVVLVSPPLYGAEPVDREAAPVQRRSGAAGDLQEGESEDATAAEAPQRFEILAIAALRAAVEPNHSGVLDPQEVTALGQAMFIQ